MFELWRFNCNSCRSKNMCPLFGAVRYSACPLSSEVSAIQHYREVLLCFQFADGVTNIERLQIVFTLQMLVSPKPSFVILILNSNLLRFRSFVYISNCHSKVIIKKINYLKKRINYFICEFAFTPRRDLIYCITSFVVRSLTKFRSRVPKRF